MNETEKDFVLSINEYAYVMDKTKGNIFCHVGPTRIKLTQSDELVRFDCNQKRFVPCNFNKAASLFVTAPEGWYIMLKNPTISGNQPVAGTSNSAPEDIQIGRKINIPGPITFALHPCQMAKVIKGHTLRPDQYLLAKVYDAERANEPSQTKKYINGQTLVIKGTDTSFYLPPTGIEVISFYSDEYVRDAIILERLEFCVLSDEDNNKRYVYGPKVVFPKPRETFVASSDNELIFRAVELSKTTGIYIRVSEEYSDEQGVVHPVGEEQFITGNQQMIYYPRPEHLVASHDGNIIHHTVIIPRGEGRYIMNLLSGDVKTVKGPATYLPDPRTEFIINRKLSERQCGYWYPGSSDALEHNIVRHEHPAEEVFSDFIQLEADPTSDDSLDGVVSIDVWTGYAVSVVSKDGSRKVVCGPQTVILDYDQTLDELTIGDPRMRKRTFRTVFLQYENNKIEDIVKVETKDFVDVAIKVSYSVNFDKKYISKWFNLENYTRYLRDRQGSLIKKMAKEFTLEELYQNTSALIKSTISEKSARHFLENGMYVYDLEVLSITSESAAANVIYRHRNEIVLKSLELSSIGQNIILTEKLAEVRAKQRELDSQELIHQMELQKIETLCKQENQSEVNRQLELEKRAAKQAEADLQLTDNEIAKAERERREKDNHLELAYQQTVLDMDKIRKDNYAEAVSKIISAVGPGLAAALNNTANASMLEAVASTISPHAMAKGGSIADVVNTLLRGTSLENVLEGVSLSIDR